MKSLKKWVAMATAVMMLGSAGSLRAQSDVYYTDTGGYGYEEGSRTPNLAPAIALGTIAIIAIIAVAVQNSTKGSNNGHCH